MNIRTAVLLLSMTTLAVLAAEVEKKPRSGEQIYREYCVSCHGAGWQGAPVTNDKAEWEPRVAKGADAMLQNVRQGINGMPPMGTCIDCSDTELKSAISEMLQF